MKVTAILPDRLIRDVKTFAKTRTTTEALVVALSDWLRAKKLTCLGEEVAKNPLKFQIGFDTERLRELRSAKRG